MKQRSFTGIRKKTYDAGAVGQEKHRRLPDRLRDSLRKRTIFPGIRQIQFGSTDGPDQSSKASPEPDISPNPRALQARKPCVVGSKIPAESVVVMNWRLMGTQAGLDHWLNSSRVSIKVSTRWVKKSPSEPLVRNRWAARTNRIFLVNVTNSI